MELMREQIEEALDAVKKLNSLLQQDRREMDKHLLDIAQKYGDYPRGKTINPWHGIETAEKCCAELDAVKAQRDKLVNVLEHVEGFSFTEYFERLHKADDVCNAWIVIKSMAKRALAEIKAQGK